MKIREVLATVKHCNSGWQEQKLVHILFTDRDEKYQLLKPYCVEYGKNVIFSKTDNEILLPDLARRTYRAKEYTDVSSHPQKRGFVMARRAARFCVRSRQQMSGILSNQKLRFVQQSIGVRCTTLLRAMFT